MKHLKWLIPLLIVVAGLAQTTTPVGGGGLATSCNAVTTATSNNPGTAGGCVSISLPAPNGQLPGGFTWQTTTTGSPTSITVNFMGSIDNINWAQLDTATSTSGTIAPRSVTGSPMRYVGCVPATITGGASPTLTCQLTVTTNSAGGGKGGGGSTTFSSITAGTNTNALVIGTGGSLTTSGSGTITATNGLQSGTQYNPLINTTGAALYATSPVFFDTTQASGADRGAAVHGIWTTGYGANPVKALTMDMRAEIVNDATLGHGQIIFTTNPFPVTATYGGSDANVGPTFILPAAGMQMGAPVQIGGDQMLIQGEGPGGVLAGNIQGTLFSPASGTCPIFTSTATAANPAVVDFGVNAGNIAQGLGPYSNKIGGFAVDADYYAPAATVQSNCIPFTYYSGQDLNIIDWISVQNGMGVNLDMGGGSSSVAGNGTIGHVFSKHADTNSCISQTATISSWAVSACGPANAFACAVITYSGTPSTGTVTTANSAGNTTLTIATGPNFPYQTTVTAGSITVNGVAQTIVSVQSATQITISGNLGTHTYAYNIGLAEPPQIGGGVLVSGTATGAHYNINRSDYAKVCAVPGPSNTAETVDLRCQGVTFSSASQFAFLVNQGLTDSAGAGGTATYRPVGVRWDGKILSGGKELGPMSISSQTCVGDGVTGKTQAEAVGFDFSGDLEEAHDIHTESSPIGIQIGAGGITHDITMVNSNPSSQQDTGIYIDNYWGAPTDINLLGIACAATNSTGATAATTCINDIQNSNVTTSTNNKYTGFYFLDHGGDPITDADPQAGVEIANGITFFNRTFSGWNGGTAEFSLNGKTGVTTIAGATTLTVGAAANTPALKLSGSPVVGGGTGTTSTPLLCSGCAGTAATTWSTAGTAFGANPATGFTGNFMDFHLNGGISLAKLDYLGNHTATSFNTTGSNGGISGTEGTGAALTAGAGTDLLYPDSTSHCWHQNLNNVDKGCILSASSGPTLDQVLAAGASKSIANGNFTETWTSAQTTDAQDAFALNEASAATNGTLTNGLANQADFEISSATNSTAVPFEVVQTGITNTVPTPLAQFETTWNNAGLTGEGLLFNLTNTASAAASKIIDLRVGNAAKFTVDPTGTAVFGAGTIPTVGTAGGVFCIEGTAPTGASTNYGVYCNSTDHSVHVVDQTVDVGPILGNTSAVGNNQILKTNNTVGQEVISSITDNGTTISSAETLTIGTAAGSPALVDKSIGFSPSAMGAQSSATCTTITNMNWNIAANKNYILECKIPMTLAASATIQYCLNGPGTATSYSLEADGDLGTAGIWSQISTLAQTAYQTKTNASASVAANSVQHVWASIQNGATASGTQLALQTAANGTNNITVGAGAACELHQVN
jgi:hypothetical protein